MRDGDRGAAAASSRRTTGDGELVAVLGMNQVRQFTRWRRRLAASARSPRPADVHSTRLFTAG